MKNFLRRLVPGPLKRAIQTSIRGSAHTETIEQRLDFLEKQVLHLRLRLFQVEPEIIQPSPAERAKVLELLRQSGLPLEHTDLAVSKNDRMFQFANWHYLESGSVFQDYMRGGVHSIQVIAKIIEHAFGSFANVRTFLDFACGYGRSTRFLAQLLSPQQVWVSDIKAGAVAFQQQQFGYHGFVSTTQPDMISIDERFDCIYVGSLFSHLPEVAFTQWLGKLVSLLSERGMIIFTVHDFSLIDSLAPITNPDFAYRTYSEENPLMHTGDAILSDQDYGTSYVSERFVREAIAQTSIGEHRYARFPKGMWNRQDIYVCWRGGDKEFTRLKLPYL